MVQSPDCERERRPGRSQVKADDESSFIEPLVSRLLERPRLSMSPRDLLAHGSVRFHGRHTCGGEARESRWLALSGVFPDLLRVTTRDGPNRRLTGAHARFLICTSAYDDRSSPSGSYTCVLLPATARLPLLIWPSRMDRPM